MSSIPSETPRPNASRHSRSAAPLISLAMLCILASCADQAGPEAPADPTVTTSTEDGASSSPGALPSTRARIVTLTVSLSVEDVPEAVERLRRFAEEESGYVEHAEMWSSSATLRLRIPASELSAARAQLRDLGEITSEQESVEDVTSERADLGARVRNARAREERLLVLLSRQEASLADVLSVERELSRAREDIERLEAQERMLEGRVAQAHLVVQIVASSDAFWSDPLATVANAARGGVHAAWAIVVVVVAVLAAIGPSAGLILFTFWILYRIVRFGFRRRQPTAAPAAR